MRTDEKDETAVDLPCAEFIALARQVERRLGPLFARSRSTSCARREPVERLPPLEAVESFGERATVIREIVPLDKPHAERKQRIVVVHDPEEVARIPLGKDLWTQVQPC